LILSHQPFQQDRPTGDHFAAGEGKGKGIRKGREGRVSKQVSNTVMPFRFGFTHGGSLVPSMRETGPEGHYTVKIH